MHAVSIGHPVLWAIGLAVSIAVVGRPRPRARRPCGRTDGRAAATQPPGTGERPAHLRRLIGWAGVRRRRSTRPIFVRRSADDESSELARWCEGLARAVRGGENLVVALASVPAPPRHRDEVDALVRGLDRSGDWPSAIESRSSPHLALVLAVVGACIEHGGPAAEPLDRTAEVLRSRAAEAAERRVHSSQARLSAQVLAILPVAMLIVLVTASASVRDVVARPVGLALIACGAALNLGGWLWMRRVIEGAVR